MNRNYLNHRNHPNKKGFTLAEMLIASVILAFLIATGVTISSNFFNSLRNIQAANTVYDEANFTMERIIKEVRNGTVDYEEYYNQTANFFGIETNETYGQNYCQYSRQFYSAGPDGQFGTFDDESTGERRSDPAPIAKPMQKKLYLINTEGDRRTYFQHVLIQKTDINDNPIGEPIGKVAMLKLVGKDYGINHMAWVNNQRCRDSGEGDGLVDTWVCDSGFKCAKESPPPWQVSSGGSTINCTGTLETPLDTPDHLNDVISGSVNANRGKSSFVDITPETIDVVSLDFIITPQDDPRKAYNEADIQLQPAVTVKMVVRAAPQIASTFKGQTPNIVLESTISSRTAKEVITECNLQECIDGDTKPCPKHTGMLAPLGALEGAVQTCAQGIWPGCVETCPTNPDQSCYEEVAALFIKAYPPAGAGADGLDHDAAFGGAGGAGKSFYEPSGGEIGSCGTGNAGDACKIRRCSDGVDNDVNDKTDNADPACLNYVCNNGYLDPGEDCIDVGGVCSFVHPRLIQEDFYTCSDNYDNDCSYNFDLKWDDFSNPTIVTPEQKDRAELMGVNASSSVSKMNIGLGLGADEYDQNCIDEIFCSNGIRDPQILDPQAKKFGPAFYDTPYYLIDKPESDDLTETCTDVGGLCARTTDGVHKYESSGGEIGSCGTDDICKRRRCGDGLDNDCNYDPLESGTGADEFDTSCRQIICSNGFRDCSLAPADFSTKDYLLGFRNECSDAMVDGCCDFTYPSDLDEECSDVGGGLCGGVVAENTPALCFDRMDNNCNDLKDGVIDLLTTADTDCCPDRDGDTYSSWISTCHPKNAEEEGSGPPGFIDCNDGGTYSSGDPNLQGINIKPGTTEVCDDARYPLDYPNIDIGNGNMATLAGTPVDNNCSSINRLYGDSGDSGLDSEDPSCCADTDEDNFGVKDANLYKDEGHVPPRCSATPAQPDPERTTFDCDDLNEDIHPNVFENTIALCSEILNLNNSCRFALDPITSQLDMAKPRADHIDMYVDATDQQTAKDSLKVAFDAKKFNPDCCRLTQSAKPTFQGMEICDDYRSLLNPGVLNSDENCNGLEGYNDSSCAIKTGTDATGADLYNGFHDNLTFNTYLALSSDFTALYDRRTLSDGSVNGVITIFPFDTPSQVALSGTIPVDGATCTTVKRVTINQDADLPAGTDITYEITNDAGNYWQAAPIGVETTTLLTTGIDLRWRATLSGNGSCQAGVVCPADEICVLDQCEPAIACSEVLPCADPLRQCVNEICVNKVPTLNGLTLIWSCN